MLNVCLSLFDADMLANDQFAGRQTRTVTKLTTTPCAGLLHEFACSTRWKIGARVRETSEFGGCGRWQLETRQYYAKTVRSRV